MAELKLKSYRFRAEREDDWLRLERLLAKVEKRSVKALTDDELLAIRWHMSGYDDAARAYSGGMAQGAAFGRYPLAVATAIADMYVTYFMDKKL